MKVLVVDDDVVARMMLMHLVDACGGDEIVEAEDGEQAWDMLQHECPALVLCDLRMPRLSGMDLLARMRASPRLADVPLVLVSAAGDAATREEALALGATGFIVKPLREDVVRAQLARILAPDTGTADETPAQAAARLGIDMARLQLYMDALVRQIETTQQELHSLDEGALHARLQRLYTGCTTLGLHGAAAGLSACLSRPGTAPVQLGQVLAALARRVAGQAVQRAA